MSKTYEGILSELNAKIPRDVVMEREGGGGKTFSYLAGHYVIGRMNEIFGQGNWNYIVEEVRCVHAGTVEGKYGASHTVHYIARGRLEVKSIGSIFTDVGYGDGSDKVNIGKAHELAVKEAATDAFKRCARNLGNSMGLALYDKDQEGVDDGQPEAKAPAAKGPARKPAEAKAPPPVENPVSKEPANEETEATGRETMNAMIDSTAALIASKAGVPNKGTKMAEIVKYMRDTYKVQKKTELSDKQALEFLTYLKGLV